MDASRAVQAIDGVNTDLKVPGRGIDVLEKSTTTYNFINKLWNAAENRDVRDKFLNNMLCKVCAENEHPDACREWFQTYAIQDYFYLVDYIKFKALRLTTIPQGDFDTMTAEARSIGRLPDYVGNWMDLCKRIGITPEKISSEERSVAELAYANYLQINASRDDWFNAHVIMIACAFGWSKIAKQLYDKESTVKTTDFYREWILANIDTTDPVENPDFLSKDARKLSTFLDQNVGVWSKKNDQDQKNWNTLFRTSLRLEVALFDSAFSPYGQIS